MDPTLFQQLLGARFYRLPASLRALHGIRGEGLYAGRATVVRGTRPLARLCARIAGLPPGMEDVPTTVAFVADARGETWRRDFGGKAMQSRLWRRGPWLCERLGPLQFRFALHARDDAIHWEVAAVRLLGVLPLPAALFSQVRCRERERAGRYEFRVEAAMPLIGPLVRYEGWLEPA
ncbi:DUF4166 domain-containing protein [Luteimonas sp. Y-2-2-4F]|nr:DUF4166 domain-containing protein [Luteimonas sp. Y-2-2-4F]MCD9030625.1 DUF4166 domain-containing protein [Luteimonas sp. Y-2-2-4F]